MLWLWALIFFLVDIGLEAVKNLLAGWLATWVQKRLTPSNQTEATIPETEYAAQELAWQRIHRIHVTLQNIRRNDT